MMFASYLEEFVTAIIKARNRKTREELSFSTIPLFIKWRVSRLFSAWEFF